MKLESKSVRLRYVEIEDAEFIIKLRLDEKYNAFISNTSSDVSAQREWIRKYKTDEKVGTQFYFIIERLDGTPCGTVRIYDLREDSFCWGSWILNEEKTRFAALESAFLVYRFGFEELKLGKSHFDVRKKNTKVISFHEKLGAVKTGEDDIDCFFEITKDAVAKAREKLSGKI